MLRYFATPSQLVLKFFKVSFTGSERIGKIVGKNVQDRFGKVLLELGGNNAAIVMNDADIDLALTAILFSAVGTAGQRCTSTRRLFLHRSIADSFLQRLEAAYYSVPMGDPLDSSTLIGPLHTPDAVKKYHTAIDEILSSGGKILTDSSKFTLPSSGALPEGNFVTPVIAIPNPSPSTPEEKAAVEKIWNEEVFAPILKVAVFDELDEAIALNNGVPQGLSSCLWSNDVRNLGKWIGPTGSDAGIVNVSHFLPFYGLQHMLTVLYKLQFNVGTSGAEIGAAFGGNKSTGW